jgi:TP901 family phage tail tape measure protein
MADTLDTNILIKIIDAFTAPLRKLGSGLDDAKAHADKLQKAFQLAGDLNQAAEAAGRFGNMIRGPLESSVKEFIGFEQVMSKVAALSGEIGSEGFEKMRVQALELGAATSYSSQEAAEAMAQYAQAGRSVNEILAVTPLTLAAAKANGTGLAETAAIIGHTMSGMGIATSETARVVDVLTAAAAASDMNLGDMGTALAYVGPVARQAGMSLELTAAMLGKMKDAGLEASATGTGLRAVLSRLLDPSHEATKAFGKLGIKNKELAALQKEVASGHPELALRRIGEAAEKLPNEQRMKLMAQIFGMEASTAANVAISVSMDSSTKGLGALNDSLHHVDGTAKRLAGVMEDNLGGSIERAGGAISGLKTKIGEVLKPTVQSAAGSIEALAGSFAEMAKEYPIATRGALELVSGLGALALGMKAMLLTASMSVSTIASLSKAFTVMSASLGGSIALVAGAGVAGYAVGSWIEGLLGLADKLSWLAGRGAPTTQEKPGMGDQAGKPVNLAGGWIMNPETGGIMRRGSVSTTPKSVRDAYAAGAKNDQQANAFIRRKRELAADAAAGGGTKLEQQARANARDANPLLDDEGHGGTPTLLRAPAAPGAPAALMPGEAEAARLQKQTDALLETQRKTEKHLADLLELERRKQPRPVYGEPFSAY